MVDSRLGSFTKILKSTVSCGVDLVVLRPKNSEWMILLKKRCVETGKHLIGKLIKNFGGYVQNGLDGVRPRGARGANVTWFPKVYRKRKFRNFELL